MRSRMARIALTMLIALVVPATVSAADFGFKGFGPRVGLSSDPDQAVGGIHFDLGEFASHVRFQPSLEVGFGDDTTTFQANFMVAYYFPVEASVTPYAGGSLSAAYYDFDACKGFGAQFFRRGSCDDSETEIGPVGVGGIEMKLSGEARFLAELQLGFADLPEAKIIAGWTF